MIIEDNKHKMELVNQVMCSGYCGGSFRLITYVTFYAADFFIAIPLTTSIYSLT